MKAILVLEDGTTFTGTSFGAEGEITGEVIFNTQVVGWQEILTDPANAGKIISIGYPHVGNYGINDRCFESNQTHASAFVVKEYSKLYSNWQAKESLGDFMRKNGVIGIEGIDTRTLTIHIRDNGEMGAVVSTEDFDVQSLVRKAKETKSKSRLLSGQNPKSKIIEKTQNPKSQTVIIDLGVNNSTLAKFAEAQIVPANIKADDIIAKKVEQVVLSSGPGDPRQYAALAGEIKQLIGKVKIYGIQNGACVLAQALGGTIYKMKVGHHGVNHPVVDPKTGRGEISAQNHSYGIEQLPSSVKVAHVNLNDQTIEKFESKDGLCVGTLYFPIDGRGKLPAGYKLV
jgi:carbamoyl-phosphate synthase small subunit